MVKTFIAVSVDTEFRELCPKLTDEEERLLRDSIIAEGCRDEIVAWNHDGNPILDGHNRYEICTVEEIPYRARLLDLPDRQACREWIIRHQLGRRNVTEDQKSYLRGKLYREQKQAAGRPVGGKCGQNVHINLSEKIAAETGVNERTVRRDADFSQAVDDLAEKSPELAHAARAGEIPKSIVPELAKAPKKQLKPLAKLEGQELRKAVREVTEGSADEEEQAPEDDSAEGVMKATNSAIESFCRSLIAFVEQNMPTDEWITKDGRGEQAIQKIRDACSTMRSCKCTAVCPKCNGEGCSKCLNTGRVTKYVLEQIT